MKLTIDTDQKTLVRESGGSSETVPLYSDRAFDLIAEQWVNVGWNQKYSYTFSWMGRPIIQLPEDMIRTQEVIHRVRPDVIVETGRRLLLNKRNRASTKAAASRYFES